jgi:large subunit ribosomal protein L23
VNKIKTLKTQSLRTMLGLIKYPLITDKTTKLLELNKYSFIVDKRANKFTIKKVIEYIFNVNILNVNTLTNPLKTKTVGRFFGYKSKYKKAIITLKEGDTINLFPDI